MITFKNFSVFHQKKHLLKNLNLNFEINKVHVLLGPSGSGKSTLLKSINALIKEYDSLQIQGILNFKTENIYDMNEQKIKMIRKKCSLIFQQPSPFPLSIKDNLSIVLKEHKTSLKIEKLLKLVGLWEEVKSNLNLNATQLSGGQQQRLCIARALCTQPEVILFDEPTSALDIKSTIAIEQLVLELKKDHTIFFATHSLEQAKKLADTVTLISEASIIEHQSKTKFFNSPKSKLAKEYLSYFTK